MSKSRKDPQKRKARQEAVRKRVLERRDEIRTERKKIREEFEKEKLMHELEHGKPTQLLPGNPTLAEKRIMEREMMAVNKIKKNLEVLKGLEEEYDREQASRKHLNSELESEGFTTIKEKMDALQQKLQKFVQENTDPSQIDGMPEEHNQENSVVQ
jgi:hypothetical protein